MRRTKIVATIGPASFDRDIIAGMIRAGMDVARLNTSHGTLESHAHAAALVREVAAAEGRHVGVLMDLAGPKLRTGETSDGHPIDLVPGAALRLVDHAVPGTSRVLTVEYPGLYEDVQAGETVLLDDGQVELVVEEVTPAGVDCRVVVGGPLGPHKGVSFPHTNLTTPALTGKDMEAIRAGAGASVDYFGLSFVRDAADIVRTRDFIGSLGHDIPIVAKIERRQAVENLDAILAEADGAMVARGDLGVELPPEDVPIQQRRIIASAARNMIPVITATQMLESMITAPRPTRAEASDVANAVWDLSDALMLSGETATGRYPVESVAMMNRIVTRAEGAISEAETATAPAPETDDHSYVIALAARRIVEFDANIRGVACFTKSGYTAMLLSKVHPDATVFGISPSEAICRRLALARGVIPVLSTTATSSEELLHTVDDALLGGHHLALGDEVVVVASLPVRAQGTTNFLKLHRVGDSASYVW